jgi:serine/threonine protein kinase
MTAQRPAWQGGTRELHAYGAALGEAPPGAVAPPPAFQAPALPPGAAPAPPPGPGAPPAHFGRTVERAAVDMKNLPAWAKTGFRKIDPDALKVPAEPEKKPKKDGLQEPSGPVPGFEMQEKISKGKTGVVYRALEKETGRIVALKVMYPIFMKNAHLVERFKREAKIASRIDHPNILKVYSGGEAGGHLYVSMELVEGETLHEKIEKQTVLPEPDALRWIAQIARAMDHYGRQGIVHRDVKPEHVLITKDNRALLCELGMSKKAYEEFAQTAQGSSFGAPYYVSPEQGMGVLELDIRSDIYSLGVTLFHCLTGRVPFLGGNAGVIISKHATEAIPDVRKLNPKVTKGAAALIERMMAKKREDRHQTPKELLAEIAWLRSESGVSSTPIVPLDPPGSDDQKPAAPPKPPARKPGIFQRMLRAVGFAR